MSARERILDAAADIMRERGVARATTKEIAKAAGYSEATLYKNFSDKEELIVQVLRERMPDLSGMGPRPGDATVEGNLAGIAGASTVFYQRALPLFGGLLAEHTRIAAHRENMSRHGAGPGHGIGRIAEYLRAEQDLGRVAADADVETVAALLDGACFHQAFLRYYADGPDAGPVPEETVTRIARTLARSL
ncbi:TetR/AcrR family transcriptional regulator [Nocardia amikacinitolerans]|uniref:TetR/AcrR family transcriptional regulator n=1 Tax=Nocardia amikacinitolerans TaxID=756689 RepID=UPI0020A5EE25|nr:TetR/AcrR family transcriptional regulator [Nocardia amikacinitolerans]MCP2279497.1 transcriptional regulator, TetR family [Nocardia amikacinitolerans]MCP2296706.1 transcriptional regulator, TetR family [Nocardia amikacinitolerans]